MDMNSQQARVIDPVLTSHAQGYKNQKFVGHLLFPRVAVTTRGGKTLKFDKSAFYLYNARRAPGAKTSRIGFGYEGEPFALVEDSLEVPIPREYQQEAQKVPGINLAMRGTNLVMHSLRLLLENEQAELAKDASKYSNDQKITLAGADMWSDPNSDPINDMDVAKEAVRQSAGVDPNVMVIGSPVFTALKNHPAIVERFKYTSAESITAQMLANLFDLEHLGVGKAISTGSTMSPDKDDPFQDVWGNVGILSYSPQTPQGMEEPSYGYTYTLEGNPMVEVPYYDNPTKSWVVGATYERQPVQTGIAAGYLFQNLA